MRYSRRREYSGADGIRRNADDETVKVTKKRLQIQFTENPEWYEMRDLR